MRLLRLVPRDTKIAFMKGRFAGLIVSAVLSTASVILFFHPGLNYSIDFRGGIVAELRMPEGVDAAAIRAKLQELKFGEIDIQTFGSSRDLIVRLGGQAANESARQAIQTTMAQSFPNVEIRRLDVVGAKVSGELFRDGMIASALALLAILIYVWFRFDWPFGVGVVATLLLDTTKTIGFFAVTQLQFDLNSIAAILILIGYSVTDKVVVYDRIRENLRKFSRMPLRDLIDLSINQTLSRTVATSLTVLLAIAPLAILGAQSVRVLAITIVFGVIIGTSSSIFIASPILLFVGERRLRPTVAQRQVPRASAKPAE